GPLATVIGAGTMRVPHLRVRPNLDPLVPKGQLQPAGSLILSARFSDPNDALLGSGHLLDHLE
ncbi:MAG: hypothetical protein MUO50_15350, partial [Longimicrobiales bacterium]|nr:hypothetical protein [Longimicrobiales bacterium]